MKSRKIQKFLREKVAVIKDGDTELFVFSAFGKDPLARIETAIHGNDPTFMKMFESADRRSNYRYININRVFSLEVRHLDIPADIKALYDELETEGISEEREDEIIRELDIYFGTF